MLCDDHELVRRGLSSILEGVGGITVVAEAGDADAALKAVEASHPDVVIMDVRLPGRSGIEACREIRSAFPDTKVLMLTAHSDDEALFSSIMAGAAGFVLKQVRGSDLVGAIRQVARGESLLDPTVTARVLARLRGDGAQPNDGTADLTPQERKILDLVAEGMTNRQIAEKVFLAEKTVKNYVSNILMKLGLSRRAEAAAFMARRSAGKRRNQRLVVRGERVESTSQTRVHELSRTKSIELLQLHAYVGRIGLVVDGRPLIVPVNYLADDESIVFCTEPGTKLSAVGAGAPVVFEVDDSRPCTTPGGVSSSREQRTRSPTKTSWRRCGGGPLHSWATRSTQHWVRISMDEVTGQAHPRDLTTSRKQRRAAQGRWSHARVPYVTRFRRPRSLPPRSRGHKTRE